MRKYFTHVIISIFYSFIVLSLIVMMSCGGGGGDSTPAPTINVNASGYPDVAGLYLWNVNAGTLYCSDGSSTPANAIAKNILIMQNVNQILLGDTSSSTLPSTITVVSGTNMTGNVDLVGNFIANQNMVARFSGVAGDNTVLYNLTGTFTATGWSGNYKMTMSNPIMGSCSTTLPFTGELISKSAAIKSPSEQAEADGTPVKVESVYDLATRLLGLSVDGSGPDNP